MDLLGSLQHRQRFFSFCTVFVLSLVLHRIVDVSFYPFDSSLYWSLSSPSIIINFPEVARGYFYPLVLVPVHALADLVGDNGRIVFQFASSAVYAYLLTGPVTNFFLRTFGGKLSFARRTTFALLTIALFPGLFLFPLSDLPALLVLIIGVALASRANSKYWLCWLFLSGAAVSAAYNIRTIYLFAAMALFFVVLFVFMRDKSWRLRTIGMLAFVLGALIVATPQMLINKRIHGTATPLVIAMVKGKPLMAQQLYWGVVVQRYETYAGKDSLAPSLYYRDPAGIALRNLEGSSFSDPNLRGYLSMVLKHPVQFLGIYGRHFINGLDVRDGIVYAEKSSTNKSVVSFLCFTLLFFCIFIYWLRKEKRWIEAAYLAPVLLPVLAILPGAVETRFFMPVYLVLFGAVVTRFEWATFKATICQYWLLLSLIFIFLSSVSLGITSAAMACISYELP
ncbi:hypothetical protein [Pseudomonas fluorescens]|uniref:Glycosyltransferase RgtA/B/C/D-like domain-containing protein n=1 Tax=Pseudomonas fluorescens TaxID=294 RepID=A0A0F4UL36_PSEFL|nr:hypothetical protein [Pseudomonas fluorescens]KJZ56965.1 hypothetical protein VD17_30610 [Pseudomonas fluorescens]